MMQYSYNNKYGIGSIYNPNLGLKVNCVLTNKGNKRAAQLAYIGARLSRDNNPIEEIIDSVYENNIDSDKRMELISYNYGHSSVGDMAQIYVFLENIPMYTAMKLFYKIPVLSGQENSSRYINFDNWNFISPNLMISEELKSQYNSIMLKWKELYLSSQDLYKKELKLHFIPKNKREENSFNARVLDCARHFIPIGITTNLMITTSARQWSKIISDFRSSKEYVTRELGKMLLQLLGENEELEALGYTPEAPGLIRHSEPKYHLKDAYLTIKKLVLKELNKEDTFLVEIEPNEDKSKLEIPTFSYVEAHADEYKILVGFRYLVHFFNLKIKENCEGSGLFLEKIQEILLSHCNHHNELDNVGDFGFKTISETMDIGSIKDFNRHRSSERFIPLLEDLYPLQLSNDFVQAAYWNPPINSLQKEAESILDLTYNWFEDITSELKIQNTWDNQYLTLTEWLKYLLPHGYTETIEMGFSPKDLNYFYHLRKRPGGHINYRLLAEKFVDKNDINVLDNNEFFSRA